MLPVFPADNGFQIGPFLVSPEGGRARARAWPEWIGMVVPMEVIRVDRLPWRPVAYSSRADGGAWVIWRRGDRDGSGNVLLLLDEHGDLRGTFPLPGDWTQTPADILSFDEWTAVRGLVLRGDRPVGKIDLWSVDVLMALMKRAACLGDEGHLLLPCGQAIGPDGASRQVFDPRRAVREIAGAVAAHGKSRSGTGRQELSVLGWEDNTIWLLVTFAEMERRDVLSAAVARIRARGTAAPSVEDLLLRHDLQSADVFRLPDGGWVIRMTERQPGDGPSAEPDDGPGSEERWLARFPGVDGAVEIDPSACCGLRGVVLRQFAWFRKTGPVAVLDGEGDDGRRKTFLLTWNDGRPVPIPALPVEFERAADLLRDGWVPVPGAGETGTALILAPKGAGWLRGTAMTVQAIRRAVIRSVHRAGKPEHVNVRHLFFAKGTLVVHGDIFAFDDRDDMEFFSSFRIDRGSLTHMRTLAIDQRTGGILFVERGDADMIAFSTEGTAGRGGAILVLIRENGDIMISLTC